MKYLEIVDYILEGIERGEYKTGKLPSIRAITVDLKCNKGTVQRAYRELEESHVIYSVPKSGYYLVDKAFKKPADKGRIIDFTQAVPNEDILATKEYMHCFNIAMERYKENLFRYGRPEGLSSLRTAISKLVMKDQIFVRPESIFITSGSQQALDILTRMPFPNGKENVLVEQPTYSIMLKTLKLNGNKVLGVTRTQEGLDLEQVENMFKNNNIKFFYTIPRFHNPLGTSLSSKEKDKLLELAEKYDVYIVEDDYLADLEVDKKQRSIFARGMSNKIVYIRGFTKTFIPGLRLGAAILPVEIREGFMGYKKISDLSTSMLSQLALEMFISSGMYEKHVEKMQGEYKERMALLIRSLKRLGLIKTDVERFPGGFFVMLEIDREISFERLKGNLIARNVMIKAPKEFYIEGFRKSNQLRLSISNVPMSQIEKGIEAIAEELGKPEAKRLNNFGF